MLVLSRKQSQRILIGSDISITVVRVDRNQVRIGIDAPSGMKILRGELAEIPSGALSNPEAEAQETLLWTNS